MGFGAANNVLDIGPAHTGKTAAGIGAVDPAAHERHGPRLERLRMAVSPTAIRGVAMIGSNNEMPPFFGARRERHADKQDGNSDA